MSTAADQHKFIQDVLAKTGWSQTDLAHRAGLDPSTLSRFLTKGREDHALRASSMQRIATASGVPFGDIAPATENGLAESEAAPFVFRAEDPRTTALRLLSSNRQDVDAWTLTSRALENIGYRPGDILLVGLNENPVPGDIVCAQIYDWTKGQAETIFRLYQPPALIGSSNDPDLLKPFLLGDNAVAIKGVVLHTLRSRQ
jgi:transcriptional regulator with XRE-family HTH domain